MSIESTRVIVAGCVMRTIATWTEVRVVRGTPEDGVRVTAQVLMTIVVEQCGRLSLFWKVASVRKRR